MCYKAAGKDIHTSCNDLRFETAVIDRSAARTGKISSIRAVVQVADRQDILGTLITGLMVQTGGN